MKRLAYKVTLPPNLVGMHDVLHVLMLRKYIANLDVVVEHKPLGIQEGLMYVEELVKIMVQKEQVLHTKMIPVVEVLWEAEQDMQNRYMHLFET